MCCDFFLLSDWKLTHSPQNIINAWMDTRISEVKQLHTFSSQEFQFFFSYHLGCRLPPHEMKWNVISVFGLVLGDKRWWRSGSVTLWTDNTLRNSEGCSCVRVCVCERGLAEEAVIICSAPSHLSSSFYSSTSLSLSLTFILPVSPLIFPSEPLFFSFIPI